MKRGDWRSKSTKMFDQRFSECGRRSCAGKDTRTHYSIFI